MKKLSGAKNLNWKKFFVDHGEKFVFGGVAILGLATLGMSRWSPYKEKDPYDLTKQVAEAEQAHKVSTWPDTERDKFKDAENIAEKAQNLLAGIDVAKYDFGQTLESMFDPVIPPKQPIEEPKWFPVKQLVAKQGYLLYEKAVAYDPTMLGPDGLPLNPEVAATETATPADDGLDDFRPAERPATGYDGGAGSYDIPGLGGYAPGMTAPGAGGIRGGRPAAGVRGGAGGAYGGEMPAMGSEYGGEYGMAAAMPVEGVAKRYIAVRGVFPFRLEEEELARARSQSRPEVAGMIEFTDFELERQKAIAGDDPWAGEWQKVDIQVANDVLNDQARFDYDAVDPTVTNAVFTMPLPGRIMGNWDSTGTHPLLTRYDESEEYKKRQAKLQQMIAEYAAEMERQRKELPQYGGFAGQTWDVGQVGRMMAADTDYMSQMSSPMMARRGQAAGDDVNLTADQVKALITASGTYLLFRYLDFDVQPGNAYRYRVRLKLMNPNFGYPIDQVARPEVAEDQYRWTEWSEPTAAELMPADSRHFLAGIDRGGVRNPDRARFEMFQWSTETGTLVNEEISVEAGQFIGGTQSAEVIDVAAQTFQPQDFTFTSGDMLVDIELAAPGFSAARPELGLPRKFEVPAQVLLVNEAGQLVVQDQYTSAPARTAAEKRQQGIAEAYQYLKDAVAAAPGAGGMYGEGMYGGEYGGDMYSAAMMGSEGGVNPFRKGRRNRGRTPAMAVPGAMSPGMPAAGGSRGGAPRRGGARPPAGSGA